MVEIASGQVKHGQNMLTTVLVFYLLASFGVNCDYDMQNTRIVDAASGCVEVTVQLPVESPVLRIDQTNYNYTESGCVKEWDASDVVQCSIQQDGDLFTARATICDVESHNWMGWRMDNLMQNNRYAYWTVYFSHGGTWSGIQNNCIQPQQSEPINVDAAGQESVTISCVKKATCPMGPHTTIMLPNRDLCRDYSVPLCDVTDLSDDMKKLTTELTKPDSGRYSFVFCSTGDSFLSYLVDWGCEC